MRLARVRKTGNWPRLAGAESYEQAESELALFWDRFRVSYGDHTVYVLAKNNQLDLRRTIPLLVHGDEGRGKKRQGVLILNAHSILGRGVIAGRKVAIRTSDQSMNYSGHPLCSRFVLGILPKSMYEADERCYFSLVNKVCEDFATLSVDGVSGEDGSKYYAAVLFCKGDLPFLHKVGRLWRSFYNAPKRESSAKDCTGICHLCDAGIPTVPYEDLSMEGEWTLTCGTTDPWLFYPEMLENCTHLKNFPAAFFTPDPFHCWHLGEGRNFVSNCIRMVLPFVAGNNIEDQLDALFEDYKRYCAQHKRQAYASRFNQQLFALTGTDFPHGSWTKGNFTTSLVKWMAHYLNSKRNSFPEGSMLCSAVSWAHSVVFSLR